MRDSTYETKSVGERVEGLIIVGTPGQGPRTFYVAKLVRDRNRDCTYQISEHRKQP